MVEFKSPHLDSYIDELSLLIERQKDEITALTQNKAQDFDTVIRKLDELDEELSLFFTPLSHINSVLNNDKNQAVYEKATELLSKYHSWYSQNQPLFNLIKTLSPSGPTQKYIYDSMMLEFKNGGALLESKEQSKLKQINLRLSELSTKFSNNLLKATQSYELIIEKEKDIEGLSKEMIEAASITTQEGKNQFRFTLLAPSYLAYMQYGPNREYRKELYTAYNTRAPENQEIIDELLALKEQKATLLGYENYAELSLSSKDAQSQEDVLGFLNELLEASKEKAALELEELKSFAKSLDGIELQSWDVAYYSQKLKEQNYSYNEQKIKPYFEQDATIRKTLEIIGELFGIEFKQNPLKLWDDCVKCYDIYENGKPASRLYLDLESRETKRGGAWMHDYETHFVDSNDILHLPSAFVVCNFSPKNDNTPSLLTHDNLVTLFHELGHALHHLFSKERYRYVSGINNVAWDTVEFPSQLLENLAYDKKILRSISEHHKTKEPLDNSEIEAILKAKNFQSALMMLRQLEFALFDFKLHQKLYQGDEVHKLLLQIQQQTALLTPPESNRFEHGFSHIFAGGYSAGYFSYKYAEVLSADGYLKSLNDDKSINRETFARYKKEILEKGGSQPMRELYGRWLNSKPETKSLLRFCGIID